MKDSVHLIDCICLCVKILFFLSCSLLLCAANDRLAVGDSISVNETLVSDGGAFALGFISVGNSSSNLYLGIWYATITPRTIIWMANRENPLADSGGIFKVSNDSNLVLLDSEEQLQWSSKTGSDISGRNGSTAVLRNNGNLVLGQGDGSVLWQSFDYPLDSFIPGMSIRYDYRTNFSSQLSSWKNDTDPSTGDFLVKFDPTSHLQIFSWRDNKPQWRLPLWNGNQLAALKTINNDISYLTLLASEYENKLEFNLRDDSVLMRYRLDPGGEIQVLSWDDKLKSWSKLWYGPYGCQVYGHCGLNGYCDFSVSEPMCRCLQGFVPKFQDQWNNGNFSGGCVRENALYCDGRDGFQKLQSMKVPDLFTYLDNKSITECQAECLRNCSCTAYAYAYLSYGRTSRCLVWFNNLIDVGQLNGGVELNLRLAQLGSGRTSNTKKIALALSSMAAVLSFGLMLLLWKCKRSRNADYARRDHCEKEDHLGHINLVKGISTEGEELQMLTFDYIQAATDNFSNSHKLGRGGFGNVYKGKLPDGNQVAVKRLSRESGQGLLEFKNEIGLIAKLQHKNLVRLLGCCIHEEEKILVYEYMANKSLDAFIYDPTKKAMLNWDKRFDIIKGIARGLLYLHQDSRLKIIHRDLKASNILLDDDMNPKISDFGMARIFGGNQNEANTIRVVGTYGYMSPEYAMEGIFSIKSDAYSFGVMVLELVSGQRNTTFHLLMDFPMLINYAWKLWSEGKVMDFVDPAISESCSPKEVERCILVGLLCVQDRPSDRPSMSSVVFLLENEIAEYAPPKQPIFTTIRNTSENRNSTVNSVTVTMVDGR